MKALILFFGFLNIFFSNSPFVPKKIRRLNSKNAKRILVFSKNVPQMHNDQIAIALKPYVIGSSIPLFILFAIVNTVWQDRTVELSALAIATITPLVFAFLVLVPDNLFFKRYAKIMEGVFDLLINPKIAIILSIGLTFYLFFYGDQIDDVKAMIQSIFDILLKGMLSVLVIVTLLFTLLPILSKHLFMLLIRRLAKVFIRLKNHNPINLILGFFSIIVFLGKFVNYCLETNFKN